jgi:hypothetical protein
MEDDSKSKGIINWMLGAMGLGAVGVAFTIPKYGIWLALAIVVLALLLFGAYFLYRRLKARRQSRHFEGAIQAQTAGSPRAISDPNRRAALDKLRQKFQTGLQEFKSRGKDIYKLPWYVIIGEPGSGKSEAIRHSGLDFPPGLQDELQGSGGTVNMDWWFTNRSIILDTAGSMIFNESQAGEAPEWREFLRLLRKARPNCPVNGLFLVLSVESLIKDSADKIAQKAGKLAQQLDMIQRTLDVRFPVYLLVTKCDLLTGFREFFDNIEDPLLQHQIFGWSNPEPLDAHFRPELVEQHLKIVAERVRRRRLALLRESATAVRYGETAFFTSKAQTGATSKRRLDEVDSLYALPESVMLLAPRLRRYLETIFVAGEWSAKPVFLRGIYFTSSMREGRALDEAMALATGVALDQLPEDRPWEKNRSYFMRDLFLEKVFRENGLVTRATNTLQLVRKRKILIFGVASLLLLLLLGVSYLSYRSLNRSVLAESSYWNSGATNWNHGEWSPPLVRAGGDANIYHFLYAGADPVPGVAGLDVVGYHQRLMEITDKPLAVSWVFKPMTWFTSGRDMNRQEARRLLLEGGVLKPLVARTREKMEHKDSLAADPLSLALHREALLSLIRLEVDNLAGGGGLTGTNAAEAAARYVSSFQSYLIDTNQPADTNLVAVIVHTYGGNKTGTAKWPPESLLGGNSLATNRAVSNGLAVFLNANRKSQAALENEVKLVGDVADSLHLYEQKEADWLAGPADPCAALQAGGSLAAARLTVEQGWLSLRSPANGGIDPNTNLTANYQQLQNVAEAGSANVFQAITNNLPENSKTSGLIADILLQLQGFAQQSRDNVRKNSAQRAAWLAAVDRDQLTPAGNGLMAGDARWCLYTNACALAGATLPVDDRIIGNEWKRLNELKTNSENFRLQLAAYHGPLAEPASNMCQRIAGAAEVKVKGQFVDNYAQLAVTLLNQHLDLAAWSPDNAAASRDLIERLTRDLKAASGQFNAEDLSRLQPVAQCLLNNAAQLSRKIGFPVLLNANADQPMSPADLTALHNLLPALAAALKDPAWSSVLDDASGKRAPLVVQNLNAYNDVISALLNQDGKPAAMELFFLPPKEGAEAAIIRVYRRVDVTLGDADSKWQEADRHIGEGPLSLIKGTVGDGVKIAFQTLENQPALSAENQAAWALVRLIHLGRLQRSDSGTEWTLSVKLQDQPQGIEGPVVFKFVTERKLPKPEDWPQQ